jgi:thioredoxin 1
MLSPIIDELARDYAGKILFGKLNVDRNRKIPMEYQIMSIPTLLIFKDGKLVDRLVGARPRKSLEAVITRHL